MDSDEKKDKKRRASLDAEMLARYKASRGRMSDTNQTDSSDIDELLILHNESLDNQSVSMAEDTSFRDTTQSSISASENEGDTDFDKMTGRIAELEDVVDGKEAIIQSLTSEFDMLRNHSSNSSQSHNSNTQFNDILHIYQAKLKDFEVAVLKRDDLIQSLTLSLEESLLSRDNIQLQLQEMIKIPVVNETTISHYPPEAIEKINELQKSLHYNIELAKKNDEENTKSINNLNEKLRISELHLNTNHQETINLQKEYELQVEKINKDMMIVVEKFESDGAYKNSQILQLENDIKNLESKYNNDIIDMENKHSDELNKCQLKLLNYEKTIEKLKLDKKNDKIEVNKSQNLLLRCQDDKYLLNDQIKLLQDQIQDLTAKCIATTSILESKESIERSLDDALANLTSLKDENDILKSKYDDISGKYSAIKSLIDNNQLLNDRSLTTDRLSEFSKASFMSELNTTTYQNLDELSLQIQMSKTKLDEKEKMQKKLNDKIEKLEMNIFNSNELIDDLTKKLDDTNEKLEKTNMEKKTYEKELKDIKNKFDKLMSNIHLSSSSSSSSNNDNNDVIKKIELYSNEIINLRQIIKNKDTELIEKDNNIKLINEKLIQSQSKCNGLKSGLHQAWKQCAEQEEKLNLSVSINNSQMFHTMGESTFNQNETDNSNVSKYYHNDTTTNLNDTDKSMLIKFEKIETENNKLHDEINTLKKTIDICNNDNDLLQKQVDELKNNINILNEKHKDELSRLEAWLSGSGIDKYKKDLEDKHAKEMDELRKFFEEKCLQMKKQYSEEVFNQQSKKMSDDSSEIDELTDDLYYGGGDVTLGDSIDIEKLNNSPKKICQTIEKVLLEVESDSEENWPTELLQLRNKFTSDAKREMEKLKEIHRSEISHIKEEHLRGVSRIIERHNDEIKKLKDNNNNNNDSNKFDDSQSLDINDELMKQKNLYKTCVTLKNLVVDLVKYIVTCEEELNNTFIGEIIKRQIENNKKSNDDLSEKEINTNDDYTNLPKNKIKRVHFAPKMNKISSIVNSETDILLKLVEEEKDISTKLREELEKCIDIMKTESAEIIDISLSPGETMLDTITKQIVWTTKINEELNAKLQEAETTIQDYQQESEQLKITINTLQQKLIIDDNKEIISEGYGEKDDTTNDIIEEDLIQLQEKARLAIISGDNDSNYLLQLIEELSRCNEKISEDSKKDKEDLQLQQVSLDPLSSQSIHKLRYQKVAAADKQLRSTRQFLEEQAYEREAERDEAAIKIKLLQEQLKERERDKERDLRISSESASSSRESSVATCISPTTCIPEFVESLESQVREMSSLISITESKKLDTENELQSAISKISDLREIIRDFEQQLLIKNQNEESFKIQIEHLKDIIKTKKNHQRELENELEAIKIGDDDQMNDHLSHLQDELRKHKLSTEHFNVNSTALKQMKIEIYEMSKHLDKRINELETLHMCGSNLSISQPSEDVSIRDQIDSSRCKTPDDDTTSPPTLPLDQILKLKDKLLKHSRTEEVAFKKIKDLDIQLSNYKLQNEELIAEQEILQQNNSEQLFQLEQMRGRLEEYKHSAPFVQRQATSKLELELHDLKVKLQTMEQIIISKDLQLKNLNQQLERINNLLIEKQEEYASIVQNENDTIQQLRNQLKLLNHVKYQLDKKMAEQEDFPQLIESMLADKNDEIDHLKQQLNNKDKKIESLLDDSNNNKQQQQQQQQQQNNEPKNSARTLSDIVSINSECEDICETMRGESTRVNHNFTQNISTMKIPTVNNNNSSNNNKNNQAKDMYLDASVIPLVDSGKLNYYVPPLNLEESPTHSPNILKQISPSEVAMPSLSSESIQVSDITDNNQDNIKQKNSSGSTKYAVEDLENQLKAIYEELKNKSSTLDKREHELNELKLRLDELRTESKNSIDALTRDNDYYKNKFELLKNNETKILQDYDEIENNLKLKTEELDCYKLKIKNNENIINELKTDNKNIKQDINNLREKNNQELLKLRDLLFNKDVIIETLQTRNTEIENENKQLYEYKTKYEKCKKELIDCQNELCRLRDGINNRDSLIQRLEQMARRSTSSENNSSSDNNNNDDDNNNKDEEIHHLKEYLKEKENIIRQMNDDSKSLHRSLETIQNKMKESGNVVDLRKKLQQERKYNAEFAKMIAKLTNELKIIRDETTQQITNDNNNDIEDRVQRELDLSADLDKSILEAIEIENAEMSMNNNNNNHEYHSCNSIDIKPVKNDLEKIIEQYTDIRNKLDKQIKINQQLKCQNDDYEIQKDMFKSQINEYENRIIQIKTLFDNENKKNIDLNKIITTLKSTIRNLEIKFKKDKTTFEKLQLEDSDLINNLTIKYNASYNSEIYLRNSLTALRQEYEKIKIQLQNTLKQPQNNINTEKLDDNKTEITYAEKYEKQNREYLELNETMKKLNDEKNRCMKNLEISIEENEKLLSKIALLEDEKGHIEIDLKHTVEELKLKSDECDWLQKRIKTITNADEKRTKQKIDQENELKNLRKEIDNMRDVMNDVGIDADEIRRQLTQSLSEQAQLSQVVMSLRKTEADLKKKLNDAVSEETKLKEIINDLQIKLHTSKEHDDNDDKENNDKNTSELNFKKIIKNLNSEIERHSYEKLILHEKLKKAREDNAKLELQMCDYNELIKYNNYNYNKTDNNHEKLQHIYGKFIRADSQRKALVFQKKYLLSVIGGYQLSEETTLCILAQLTNEQKSFMTTNDNKLTPKIRFRCLVLSIISIHRMKWKVQRWKKGTRKNGTEIIRECIPGRTMFLPLNRNYQEHSPPVKDNKNNSNNNNGIDYQRYIQRMINIQETLGLASGESASNE
ncbi:cytadherence high molecular weight protein 2-like isoform X1 [Aphidius gifuensis]|uniref:cytadherence high molecular weight protein 2-like isoform X1 n=1 Tax=Aphidius gifuensis TaxID=684658 RepID=UPI001CDC7B34|nr:cytadherence high molecular weight protein 2-like isoform X1 [Aphidius gifuensis]